MRRSRVIPRAVRQLVGFGSYLMMFLLYFGGGWVTLNLASTTGGRYKSNGRKHAQLPPMLFFRFRVNLVGRSGVGLQGPSKNHGLVADRLCGYTHCHLRNNERHVPHTIIQAQSPSKPTMMWAGTPPNMKLKRCARAAQCTLQVLT